ncbi:MAG: ABC transporter permease subunit [Planctomycetota bacterium]
MNEKAPVSLFQKRVRKFKRLKRGYYSFLLLTIAYIFSFFLPIFMNSKALLVSYKGKWYCPFSTHYTNNDFELGGSDEFSKNITPNYRTLQEKFDQEKQGNWVLLPFFPYDYKEIVEAPPGKFHPQPPSFDHWFGTDIEGRDVLVRLAYGFNVSITFALVLTVITFAVGILVGAVFGYYGGWVDMIGLRLVEICQTIPFLYMVMILSALMSPKFNPDTIPILQTSFFLLVGIMTLFGWMGTTYYIRAEFLKEKAKDYVSAAISIGVSDWMIMFKHILPNALTPVVTFAPFAIVTDISSLVALDFLGFGLPIPTPSWGQTIQQGLINIERWWLVLFPFSALFVTLFLVVLIGEAVREAFDPKVFSRLR